MSRKIVDLFSVVTLFFCICGAGFAQEMGPNAYLDDIGITEEQWVQFQRSYIVKIADLQQGAQERVTKRVMEEVEKGNTPTLEMRMRFSIEELTFPEAEFYQSEMNNHFSAEQVEKIRVRNFQSFHGAMNGIEKTDDANVIVGISQFGSVQLTQGHPDFLELTPAQKEELKTIAVDHEVEATKLITESSMKFWQENPEKLTEMTELTQKISEPNSAEEIQKIMNRMSSLAAEMHRDIIPELKQLTVGNYKKFMAVMTDAQKAKIQKVMEDVPDYIWKTFPQNRDKDRPWRPGLDSWMPGMGVPDSASTTRETRPARPEGKKTFPTQENEE